MFKKLSGPKRVKRRVVVHVPTDGDGFAKHSLFLVYEIQENSVNNDRMAKFEAGDPDTDWLNEVIKGWDQYYQDDGTTPVDFNSQELKEFLDVPYQRIAALTEYFNAANGGFGRRKN